MVSRTEHESVLVSALCTGVQLLYALRPEDTAALQTCEKRAKNAGPGT